MCSIRAAREYGLKLTMEDRVGDFRVHLFRRAFEYDALGVIHPANATDIEPVSDGLKHDEPVSDGLKHDEPVNDEVSTDKAGISSKNDGLSDGLSDGLKSDLAKKIMDLMQEEPSITKNEISFKLHKSLITIERTIRWLVNNKMIYRDGARKNGRWIVSER